MSISSRVFQQHGLAAPYPITASATATEVSSEDGAITLTGSATITSLNHPNGRIIPGRNLLLFGANVSGTNITVTHTAASSAVAGQMVLLAGSNFTLDRGKFLNLIQMPDGIWYQV